MIKVLKCAPDEELRRLRGVILTLRGCDVVSPGTPEAAIDEIHSGKFDVLLLCHQLGVENSDMLCETFKQQFPFGRIVFIHSPRMHPVICAADQVVSADDPDEMIGAVFGVPYLIRIRGSRRANTN
jgi:CheY-like chemotaxis protein